MAGKMMRVRRMPFQSPEHQQNPKEIQGWQNLAF